MKKLACALALALSLHAGAARGADWTFNVKVDVDSIHPDVKAVYVICYVAPIPEFDAPNVVNRIESLVEVPLQNHAYHGMVVVTASMPAGKDPGLEKYWQCGIKLKKSTMEWQWPQQGSNIVMWGRAKSGVPFKPYLSGSLP